MRILKINDLTSNKTTWILKICRITSLFVIKNGRKKIRIYKMQKYKIQKYKNTQKNTFMSCSLQQDLESKVAAEFTTVG